MACSVHRRMVPVRSAAIALSLAVLLPHAFALDEGRTEQGAHYVTGGVSLDEREALQAERSRHSLWVVVATAGTGAYTGDTQVTIRDAGGKVVFDRSLDGPWLFIDLPLGQYTVAARWDGGNQRRKTHIHAGDHHQMIFRLPTPADSTPPATEQRKSQATEPSAPITATSFERSTAC